MKPLKKLPKDLTTVRILSLAKSGETKKKIAIALSMTESQFRRHTAALVDEGLLHFDLQRKVWITTDRGITFLKEDQSQENTS
jgi:predicted transcriptional regulator